MLHIKNPKLNGKLIIKITIIIILAFHIKPNSVYSQKYEYIGKDSVLIINRMMSYHLYLLKKRYTFEDITFKEYNSNSFKSIYDSLCNLYIPFKKYYLEGDIEAGNDMSGLSVMFNFLADTNINYCLWIFIPDSIYHFEHLTKSDVKKKLFKLNKFGILAFIDSTDKKSFDSNQSIQEFSVRYKNMLKKLHKKKKSRN